MMKTTLILSALATQYVSGNADEKVMMYAAGKTNLCNANYEKCYDLCGKVASELTTDQCSHLCCVHENAIEELEKKKVSATENQ